MPTEINGLPAHVLLVHFVVVMIPITALLLLLSAFWPAARHRIGVVLPILALLSLISVPITANAGDWLRQQMGGGSPQITQHAHFADLLLPWTIGLFVVSAAVWAVHRFVPAARAGRALTIGLAVVSLVVAIGSVFAVYRVGDSGAKAAWDGVIAAE